MAMNRRRLWSVCAALLAAISLVSCGLTPAVKTRPWPVRYAVTDLGTVNRAIYGDVSGPDASVDGINSYGQIVGRIGRHAFLRTPSSPGGAVGTMLQFDGILPGQPISTSHINDYGQVAGIFGEPALQYRAGEAFLWTPTKPHGSVGTVTDLGRGDLIGGLNNWGQVAYTMGTSGHLWTPAVANGTTGTEISIAPAGQDDSDDIGGINAFGQVIVESYRGNQYSHAYLWTPFTPHGMTGHVTILRSDGGQVTDINDYGQVLGSTINGATYLWTPSTPHGGDGTMTSIDPLGAGGEVDLHHLSASGEAVGTSFDFSVIGGGDNHAVMWRPSAPHAPNGTLLNLGAVSSDADSEASDINASGTIIGTSCTRDHQISPPHCTTSQHEFVWDHAHGLHDLQTLLDPGSGYSLTDGICAIGPTGQIAVFGHDDAGRLHLLLLTPHD